MSYRWWLVVALWWVALLNYIDRQVIFSLFPLIRADLHLTDAQLGLASSSFLWVYAAASPFTGYLADRFGRRRLLIASLAIWSAVTWLTGRAETLTQLLMARGLMGAAEAFYLPAALALIADHHPEATRGRATGLHYSGLYAGIVLGGVGGGWIGEHYGWRVAFTILGIAGLVYSLILPMCLREAEGQTSRASTVGFGQAVSQLARTPGMWILLTVFVATSAANWLVYTWMPLYIFERFHLSLTESGFSATFWLQLGSVVGILAGGVLADRFARVSKGGRVAVQCAGLFVTAPFLVLAGLASSPQVLIAALGLFGLGRGVFDANAMPVLCEIVPESLRSTGFGMLNFAGVFAGGVLAAATGFAKAAIGLSIMIQAAGVILLLASLCLAALAYRLHHRAH